MAQGDAVSGWASVASGAYLDVQPGSGVEWSLFAFYSPAEISVWHTDGTHSYQITPVSAAGVPALLNNLGLVATNAKWWRIKNENGSTQYLGYDGRQTK
jgi:hypothetical protein